MNNQIFPQPTEQEVYNTILNNAKLYYPASSHYNNGMQVFCNRCKKGNLIVSFGYDKYDLCLPCTEALLMQKHGQTYYTPTPPPAPSIPTTQIPTQFQW